jgi:hypothetical protein
MSHQPTPGPEIAARLAEDLCRVSGVQGVTVGHATGMPLSSAGRTADGARDASLSAFIASRVRTMTAEGDLRGKGRVLRESRLVHASCAGRDREYLIVPCGEATVFVTVEQDAFAEIVLPGLFQVLRQYGE